MTAILEPGPQATLLQATLHGSVLCANFEDLGQHLTDSPHEFAVVLGPSVPVEEATAFAQWARVSRPDLGVILLRDQLDGSVFALALRSGMREVVETRDLAGLTTAVQRVRNVASAIAETLDAEAQAAANAAKAEAQAQLSAARESTAGAASDASRGHVTTVFSTKGGVGKSLIATNLAVALANDGAEVCLVDLDVNNGDVAIMLQLSPTRNINDIVMFNGTIDDGSVQAIVTQHSNRLAVIAAPVSLDSPDKASPEEIGKLLDTLQSMYDHIVIDTSGVFDDAALAALDHSDSIFLVGTLDIPALKGLKLATSTLDLLNYARDSWVLVLNRADAKVGLTVEEFESTLGLKAAQSLVSSREVLAAVNRGEALVSAYPSHPNSKAIKALAASLPRPGAAVTPPQVPSQGAKSAAKSRKSTGSRLRLRKG